MKLQKVCAFAVVLSSSLVVQAGKMKSYCTIDENAKVVDSGKYMVGKKAVDVALNPELRMPIASVSKVFTSLFAVSRNSPELKITTSFYYKKLDDGSYNVHIMGGHEPAFDRTDMQRLIAKMNEAGILKIKNLTFDENFKFLYEIGRSFYVPEKKFNSKGKMMTVRHFMDPLTGKDEIGAPNPDLVRLELMQSIEIQKLYPKTIAEAAKNGVTLPRKLIYEPKSVQFKASKDFNPKEMPDKAWIASPDLLQIIKNTNWYSNNHSANKILELSGGLPKFNDLFFKKLGYTEEDLKFVNGSGQNTMTTGREYNEATCSTVVKVVRTLKKKLESIEKSETALKKDAD